MTLETIYRNLFAEAVEDSYGTDLTRMLGAANYKDDRTCFFNRLSRGQIDLVLRSARVVKTDPQKELSTSAATDVARYIIQKEYWERNGAPDKAITTQLKLARCIERHGLKFSTVPLTESTDSETEDTTMGSVATVTEITDAPKKPRSKKTVKTEKPAKKASKNAAANADRKARLAAKPKEEGATTPRFSDENEFKYVRALKEGEVIPMSSKRGEAFLAFIKEEGTVSQAKIVKNVPKITTTKQDSAKVWSMYRPHLLSLGVIKAL